MKYIAFYAKLNIIKASSQKIKKLKWKNTLMNIQEKSNLKERNIAYNAKLNIIHSLQTNKKFETEEYSDKYQGNIKVKRKKYIACKAKYNQRCIASKNF